MAKFCDLFGRRWEEKMTKTNKKKATCMDQEAEREGHGPGVVRLVTSFALREKLR